MWLGRMTHKYNLFFAMIFDKEKLDHRGTCFVPKILSTNFIFKDSKPKSWYNFSLEIHLIAPAIAKAALY